MFLLFLAFPLSLSLSVFLFVFFFETQLISRDRVDEDKGGTIDKDELRKLMNTIGLHPSDVAYHLKF